MNRSCQCEHDAHFNRNVKTPFGNPGHSAAALFHPDGMTTAKTPYGTFLVCRDCADDCLGAYK